MKDAVFLALVSDLEEELENIESRRGPKGERGARGTPFIFDDHKEFILEFLVEHFKGDSKFLDTLRGADGIDGKDGKGFVFEEHQDDIERTLHSLRDVLKLSFSDLSEKEKNELKLKFENLTEEEKESLRGFKGPRGEKGRPGADFDFESHKEQIKSLLPSKEEVLSELPSKEELYKLVPSKKELKLKFDDLTQDEKLNLKGDRGPRGLRGQRGKSGVDGKDGKDVTKEDVQEVVDLNKELLRGPRGVRGLPGVCGLQGLKGEDGEDARQIIQIKILTRNKKFAFKFLFDDGTEYVTNYIDLPEKIIESVYVAGGFSGGGGSNNGSPITPVTVTIPASSSLVVDSFSLSDLTTKSYDVNFKNIAENVYSSEKLFVGKSSNTDVDYSVYARIGVANVNTSFNIVGSNVEFEVVNNNLFDITMNFLKL